MSEEIRLFGKWGFDVEVNDPGLARYINLSPSYIPHTSGRHEHTRFGKARLPIVERLINRLIAPGMIRRGKGIRRPGRNTGKKLKTMMIVENAFNIIHHQTGRNPVQVLVDAIVNSAPREEDVRITYGGISYRKAADTAPMRRVDLALRHIVEAVYHSSYKNKTTVTESLAYELIQAANNSPASKAVKRKEEKERIARSAR
ncbi:MAG: 30S ribosomal protein S7 [Candidatus Ranarchaeia archaeon]